MRWSRFDTFRVRAPEFGELLRAHRRRAGLTQQTLAQLATVSSRTIRDLESGRAHGRARTVLLVADGLGLTGLAREAFVEAGRVALHPHRPSEPDLDTEPPFPVDALVGRDSEVHAIAHTLESGRRRAISIVGLGGVGKSRTALEVARRLHDQRKWPVLWVAASQRRQREACGHLVRETRALLDSSRPDSSRLRRLIGTHNVLMVLDGINELTPTVSGLLQDLLGSCPALRVIVTSRGMVPLPGCQLTIVGPLPTPGGSASSPTDLARVPSVQLLMERLAGIHAGWTPTVGELDAAAALCRRLDGLPLGLEIAAHQSAVLNLQELASLPSMELLGLSAPAVSTGDLLSIRDVISSSFRLLAQAHVLHLRQLATLTRAWSVDDAEAALGRPRAEIVGCLVTLTGIGLVRRICHNQTTRFELLNVVREFLFLRSSLATSPARGRGDAEPAGAPGSSHVTNDHSPAARPSTAPAP